MKITITHEFPVDLETFWKQFFWDEAFNSELHLKHLGMPEWKLLETKDLGTTIQRRIRVMPKQEAPAAVRKLVGDAFAYTEEGSYDKATRVYRFRVVPTTMAEKLKTEGTFRVESLGPKRVRRIVEVSIEVKLFGVGSIVENFAAKGTQDSYEQASAYILRYISEKGL